MKILISGGAGFIGSSLACKLASRSHEVTVLDALTPQIHGEDYLQSHLYQKTQSICTFIRGDVRNPNTWVDALKGQEAVVHLAAETGTGQSMYEIYRYIETNSGGTAHMLDVIANQKTNIKRIVVASSRAIYGEGKYTCKVHGTVYPTARLDKDLKQGDFECKCPLCGSDVRIMPTDEESKIHPTSIYGITKNNQEEMVHTIGKAIGIPTVAFRYQNVYGPGQSLLNPYTGILSIFSTRIRNGKEIVIFEDGKESRDFVYIDDVVQATILGIEKENMQHPSINVGTGLSVDVVTVARYLKEAFGSDTAIRVSGNYRAGDIRHNYADIAKLKELLGFKPAVSFHVGIQSFVEWVKKQPDIQDGYEKSISEMSKKGLYK